MTTLDRRVADFSLSVRKILGQFQRLNAAFASGPQAELSQQEIRLIEYLRLVGPQKMKAVSEYLGVAVNTVTSIVDNLERKGHVQRERSPSDRRVVHVQLTDLGTAVGDASMGVKRELLRSLLEELPEGEQEVLVRLFRKIAATADIPSAERLKTG
jgi:DNA-binding MarR family transcriptional regulator